MKKVVFILFFLSIIIISSKDNKYILPNDAIRFRIVANSNSLEDQQIKYKIKKDIEAELKYLLENNGSAVEMRNSINNNLENINNIVSSKTSDYKINYGYNYFPKKEYRNVIYPEGEYESLVITIGKGLGNNWWCVLYPPLCLIDESESDYNYDLYVKKVLSKLNS